MPVICHHAAPRRDGQPWLGPPGRTAIRAHCRRTACKAAASKLGAEQPARAVVLGAGIAGLSCAQVLSRHFSQVVVLERDVIEHGTAVVQSRAGVPQFQQPHGLLLQGLRCLSRIFPGFEEALVAAGGVPLDWGIDCDFRDFGISFARAPSHLKTVCATRALFEHVMRSMVLANPRIALHTGSLARGLCFDEATAAVTGVEVRGREAVPANLVLDASGRSSRVGQWLELAGWQQPREMVVDAHVGYATRLYRIPEGYSGPKAVLCGTHPSGTRSGLLAPIEGGRWNVILGGYAGDHPPIDEAGFLAFARSLPAPTLAAAMEAAEPLGPIARYAATQNVRRGWEEVALPEGLCVLGDAVCALNPIYGQGMSVAAMEALVLDDLLRQRLGVAGGGDNGSMSSKSAAAALRGFSAELQQGIAATVEGPWLLAVGEDLSFATTVSNVPLPPQPPLLPVYFQRLALAASKDAGICAQFCSVMQMVDEPSTLFTAQMVGRVLEGEPELASQVLQTPMAQAAAASAQAQC